MMRDPVNWHVCLVRVYVPLHAYVRPCAQFRIHENKRWKRSGGVYFPDF